MRNMRNKCYRHNEFALLPLSNWHHMTWLQRKNRNPKLFLVCFDNCCLSSWNCRATDKNRRNNQTNTFTIGQIVYEKRVRLKIEEIRLFWHWNKIFRIIHQLSQRNSVFRCSRWLSRFLIGFFIYATIVRNFFQLSLFLQNLKKIRE